MLNINDDDDDDDDDDLMHFDLLYLHVDIIKHH